MARSRLRMLSCSASIFARALLGVAGVMTTISAWPTPAMAMKPSATSVILVLESAPAEVDAQALREAIARELGISVTLGTVVNPEHPTLVLRGDLEGRVTLTYQAGNERTIGRTIDLPEDSARATETLALLAGNLMRDEAAELAASLGKRPETPAEETDPEPAPASPEPIAPKPPAMERPAKRYVPPAKPSAAAPVVPKPDAPPSSVCAVLPKDVVIFGADVIPFVGTTLTSGITVRRYSLNFLGGYIEGLSGVEASLGVNIEGSFMCGFQVANVANVVAGPARGVQLTAGVNVATSVQGVQLGSINVSAGPLAGLQLGLANVAVQRATGVQLSLLNILVGDMAGAQVGLVNVAAGNAKGLQLGLVNVADRSAFSLGLLNIIRNGRTHLDLWGLESGIVMLGLKHGSNYMHNIYGAGVRVGGEGVDIAVSLGLGGRIPISKRFYADIDALGYSLHMAPSLELRTLMVQARAVLGVKLAPRFAVYGGPTYNVAYAPVPQNSELSPYGSIVLDGGSEDPVRGWLGGTLGIQVF
jgi:hypothetical protein